MSATQILIMIAELLGGLTFFLFGMSTMSSGLEQMAGGALERTLKKVTSNDFLSFFLGAGITIAIQSSSAMTVMLVGLVNSGIMGFADTFGMIMGSHVGTTLTAWLLTLGGISGDNFFQVLLKPLTFAPILAFFGIAMQMFSKSEKKKNLGLIFIGFAILMVGMDFMSTSMADVKGLSSLLGAFSSPALALIVSTVFTGIIQSSAATVAIVQALALAALGTANPITYQIAIPLVIGANIGTCMTALISCIGTNTNSKRVVAMHIYTNAIGGVVCVMLMYIVMAFSPTLMSKPVGIIGVAMIHSLFNIANTVAFIPFKTALINLCKKTVKEKTTEQHTAFLDERIFLNTPLAISECKRLTIEMAEYARKSLLTSLNLLENFNEDDSKFIFDTEALTDKYEDKLGTYLIKLSSSELSAHDSHTVGRMIHSIGDFERIADHALNIRDSALEIKEKSVVFSDNALNGIKTMINAVSEILNMTIDSFVNDDAKTASQVEPLEQVIDRLKDLLKAQHVERLQKGECTVQVGFVFNDLLTNFERVSDHCSNIAAYTLQINSSLFDTHKFLGSVKSSDSGDFVDNYEYYLKKYSL